jgi:hypothetical protein
MASAGLASRLVSGSKALRLMRLAPLDPVNLSWVSCSIAAIVV